MNVLNTKCNELRLLARIFHGFSAAIAVSSRWSLRSRLFSHFLVATICKEIASLKSDRKVLPSLRIDDFATKSHEISGLVFKGLRYLTLLSFVAGSVAVKAAPTDVPNIIDLDAIDASESPCNDFYQYSCGAWLDRLELPADKSVYYHQFSALSDQTSRGLQKLIENTEPNSKVHVLYNSCMAQESEGHLAMQEVQNMFEKIDRIRNSKSLAETVAYLQLQGVNVFFNFSSQQSLVDATEMVGFLGQGGMSLPDRSYYLDKDDKAQQNRAEFVAHIERLIKLVRIPGVRDAKGAAEEILKFETNLAESSLPIEDQGNPSVINNPVEFGDVMKAAPHFDWQKFFSYLRVHKSHSSKVKPLNLSEPKFITQFNDLLSKNKMSFVKTYLKYHFAERVASLMGKEIESEDFNFWKKTLQGAKEPQPRWKKCVQIVGSDLGDDMGQAFVKSIKDADAVKSQTKGLISAIKQEFSVNLGRLDWLDAETKDAANKKLNLVADKVAFPDQWKSSKGLLLSEKNILKNDLNATVFRAYREVQKIGRPVDKNEWYMPAWEINAYYAPSFNEIVFPYGILQSPVFDIKASVGANMGALGATVGHELTHGFDNDGSKFDGEGNAKNWWSPEIRRKFEEKSKCLVDQANQFQVLKSDPSLTVKGEQTLTENIADQGGTRLAYYAYKTLTAQKPPAPVVGKFNEDQQFFVSYAQSWCAKRTEKSLRYIISTDSHPPEMFRVNAVIMNMPEFSKAFSCKDGQDKMAPKVRCSVW